MKKIRMPSADEVQAILKTRELTFRQVTGRKFVCNQLPDRGHLTSRQMRNLRHFVYSRPPAVRRTAAPEAIPTTVRPRAKIRTADHLSVRLGFVRCPYCNKANQDPEEGRRTCLFCERTFLIKL